MLSKKGKTKETTVKTLVTRNDPGQNKKSKKKRKKLTKKVANAFQSDALQTRAINPMSRGRYPMNDGRYLPSELRAVSSLLRQSIKYDVGSYLMSLIDPESTPGTKYPDDKTEPTATYQTIYTYSTQGCQAVGAGTNAGRFCFLVKPILSWAPAPRAFQLAILLNAVSFTNDTAAWTSYFTATNWGYIEDPNALVMVPDINTNRTGLAVRVRTVSASVWCEYEGSTLLDGGSIAAAVLPHDVYGMNMANPVVGATNGYLNWENLAESRLAYQGKVKDGAYLYWRPNGSVDTEFYPSDRSMPTRQAAQATPIMVVSGILPAATLSTMGQPSIVRFRVCINYEYTTDSRVVTTIPSPYCLDAIKLAVEALMYQPQAMANDEHRGWIERVVQSVLAGGAGFILGGPVGAAAGVLAVNAPTVFRG